MKHVEFGLYNKLFSSSQFYQNIIIFSIILYPLSAAYATFLRHFAPQHNLLAD